MATPATLRRAHRSRFAIVALCVVGVLACSRADNHTSEPQTLAATPVGFEGEDEPTAGSVHKRSFESTSLGVTKDYRLYLPAGYQSSKARYPVIYLLHGLGGSENNWLELFGLAEAANAARLQAIVVMPDGDDSFYVDAEAHYDYEACLAGKGTFSSDDPTTRYCVKQPRYEQYLTKDLIEHVDAQLRTIASREARAIGGVSMGGFGALVLAFRHPDLYSVAISHSGVGSLLYERTSGALVEDPGKLMKVAGRFGALFRQLFGEKLEHWRTIDPTSLAQTLEPGKVAIYMDCGTDDVFHLQHGAAFLSQLLRKRNIDHQWHLIKGGKHDAAFWKGRIDDSLAFAMKHLAR